MLGYEEFLASKWLKIVNKFQQLNGCFGYLFSEWKYYLEKYFIFFSNRENPGGKSGILTDKKSLVGNSVEKMYAFYYLKNPMNLKRSVQHKRYDKIMGEHCSSHETGLALALYSLSIKYNIKLLLDV